jgi:hypothetical protein
VLVYNVESAESLAGTRDRWAPLIKQFGQSVSPIILGTWLRTGANAISLLTSSSLCAVVGPCVRVVCVCVCVCVCSGHPRPRGAAACESGVGGRRQGCGARDRRLVLC